MCNTIISSRPRSNIKIFSEAFLTLSLPNIYFMDNNSLSKFLLIVLVIVQLYFSFIINAFFVLPQKKKTENPERSENKTLGVIIVLVLFCVTKKEM